MAVTTAPPVTEAEAAAACLASLQDLLLRHPTAAFHLWRQAQHLVETASYPQIEICEVTEPDGGTAWKVVHDGLAFDGGDLMVLELSERTTEGEISPEDTEVRFSYGSPEDFHDFVYLLKGEPVRLPEGWSATALG